VVGGLGAECATPPPTSALLLDVDKKCHFTNIQQISHFLLIMEALGCAGGVVVSKSRTLSLFGSFIVKALYLELAGTSSSSRFLSLLELHILLSFDLSFYCAIYMLPISSKFSTCASKPQ